MLLGYDLIPAIGLLTIAVLVTATYVARAWRRGRAHFDRVDKQGGSLLLGKSVMEGYYWFMQPLARGLVAAGLTANTLSWLSLLLGFFSGLALAFGHFGSAALIATLSSILDSLDGLVARMTGQASDAGEILDATVDRYVEFFFLAGLAFYYREIPSLLILTLIALAGSFMVSYSSAKAEALQMKAPSGSMRRPERALYLILGAVFTITIATFENVHETPVPVGHPMILALGIVAVLSNASAVERMSALARGIREREKEARERREQLAASESALEEAKPAEARGAPLRRR